MQRFVILFLSCAAALQPGSTRLSAPPSPLLSRSSVPDCALSARPELLAPVLQQASCAGEQPIAAPLLPRRRRASWLDAASTGALTLLAAAAVFGGDARAAHAENELASLASSKSTSELVDPQCFARSCKSQMEACAADGDCMKGLACTAKCMGDAQCTVGCFARYNDANLEKVLQCTIEDAGCIAIATQEPGADSLLDAPMAPKALVKATPASMSGKWYKVLGFNPNYDCFECQRNSFATTSGGAASAVSRSSGGGGGGSSSSSSDGGGAALMSRGVAREASADISGGTAAVQVEYAMPRTRIGQPQETFKFDLSEKLEFDAPGNGKRTAHTEGRMFGLTFWENWYVIGENAPREPEFRFVYYTGKTLQNRYEGAFVYSRKPELPAQAMPSIYKIAREAGLDPQRACCIDNQCFTAPVDAVAKPPPLFTPVAQAGVVSEGDEAAYGAGGGAVGGGGLGAALASESGPFAALTRPLRQTVTDLTELLEDPKPYGDALFARQRPMTEVREYDANGLRTAGPIRR